MRIVIDMQGAQTQSRFRGIGRYTMAFAQGIARNCGDHEVILALNGLFPDTIATIRTGFEGVLPPQNIRVWSAPGPVMEGAPGNESRRKVAECVREAFLASLEPDIVHISSLFEGFIDDAVTSVGQFDSQTPVSVSLYDLIPLLNQDHYLKPDPAYARFYHRKIDYLKRASSLLAISDFARQEGVEYLDMSENRLVGVSTAMDACFQPLAVDDKAADKLRSKFGLNRPFVLYTGGADERKNLPRLIQAYAALPEGILDQTQLLFAGKMHAVNVASLRQEAKRAGLDPSALGFTGYITDEELVQLYNLCELYVFPSWHEGFGLPALEAMACGAPVIGANTSSLPEVIGMDEALFDPFSVPSITAKLQQALSSVEFRDALREHGLQRGANFSWDLTAQRAIAAWEETLVELAMPPTQRSVDSWPETRAMLDSNYGRLVDALAGIIRHAGDYSGTALNALANCIDQNEQQAEGFVRAQQLPPEITWRLEGPFDSSYSLALVNREIARGLAGLGHKVVLHSTEGPGDFTANQEFLDANPDLAEMHGRVPQVTEAQAHVVSRNLYPPRVADMEGRFNLLHSYGWEESNFPQQWVEAFNQSLQGMTVMSRHVKKVMIDNGVTVPLAVSGIGVDHWEGIQPDTRHQIDARSFRFLHVSSCFPRKGVDRMLDAYAQVFSAEDDVTLVIKTFDNPHNEIDRWLEEARSDRPDFPDVLVLKGDYTDAKLKGLYEQCHALVAPSRAEGFGLPMAEAMLSGQAVITTGWSGQLDFCTPKTAWLVDYHFARAHTHFNLFSSVWADPDVEHLAQTMAEVYRAPEAERQRRVGAGRKLLLGQCRWRHVAERLVGAAQQWSLPHVALEPSVGWVTTWNARCGIATYSDHLVKNMPARVAVFASRAQDLLGEDQPNVNRCWNAGDLDNLDELNQQVVEAEVNTLVIQFNYGFFDFRAFSDFLNKQLDENRVVVVMMHATTDPTHITHKKLSELVPALARCHRLLVHSPNDMNRLKAYGLIENVAVFPHGILDFVPPTAERSAQKDTLVVGSYGFFLPHKGLLELIEAMGLLREQGERIKLKMFNAEYPVADSQLLIEKAKDVIKAMGLGDVVTLCTDYLTDEACLLELAKLDLIVFPYQETGESSSAAVRYGLASGKPVAVTPLPIFEDVGGAVFRLPGQSPREIAAGIKDIKRTFERRDPAADTVAGTAASWREQHRYSGVARRLFNMLFALRNDVDQS